MIMAARLTQYTCLYIFSTGCTKTVHGGNKTHIPSSVFLYIVFGIDEQELGAHNSYLQEGVLSAAVNIFKVAIYSSSF